MTSAKPQSQSHEPHESQKTQSPYAQLFRIPGTKAFCVSGAIARLPMSMMGLGIVLALNHMYDNWTIAGVMSAAYVLATAAVTPLYARLFDRFGQRKVGPVILTVQVIVMLGFAFAALMRVPIPLLFVLAVVMGMTQFSFGALVRTRWAYVLDRADKEDLLNTAYALESAIDEIVFIFGPILAAFLAASVHPVSQLFVPTLACAFGGAVFFALRDTQPLVLREITVVAAGTDDADVRLAAGGAAGAAVSADRFDLDRLKTGDRDRRKRNVLTYAGVLPLLAVFIVFNMAFTAFDTSMTAVMKSLHLDSVLGVQLAMLAVGSCMGALVFGSRELKGSRWRHMIMFLALMTVGFVVIHLCQGNLIVMGLVEILTGLTDRREAAKQLYAWGAKEILISHNSEMLVYDGKDFFTCPVKARNLSGRTGRGDTTFGAYLAKRMTGSPIAEALLFATAAVSLKMEAPGPLSASEADIQKYIDEFYA